MKIIEARATLLNPINVNAGLGQLQFIEQMARISHRSEGLQTDKTWERFIKAVVLEHGDWSVTEHSTATVLFRVARGVMFELTRHRLFSPTAESTRFVNYTRDEFGLEFIIPAEQPDAANDVPWRRSIEQAEQSYYELITRRGWKPQDARSVLPNALAATIGVTGNFRNWRHAFLMRTTKETHPDFRQVMIPLLETFKSRIPLLYDDIDPMARQVENLKKPR